MPVGFRLIAIAFGHAAYRSRLWRQAPLLRDDDNNSIRTAHSVGQPHGGRVWQCRMLTAPTKSEAPDRLRAGALVNYRGPSKGFGSGNFIAPAPPSKAGKQQIADNRPMVGMLHRDGMHIIREQPAANPDLIDPQHGELVDDGVAPASSRIDKSVNRHWREQAKNGIACGSIEIPADDEPPMQSFFLNRRQHCG